MHRLVLAAAVALGACGTEEALAPVQDLDSLQTPVTVQAKDAPDQTRRVGPVGPRSLHVAPMARISIGEGPQGPNTAQDVPVVSWVQVVPGAAYVGVWEIRARLAEPLAVQPGQDVWIGAYVVGMNVGQFGVQAPVDGSMNQFRNGDWVSSPRFTGDQAFRLLSGGTTVFDQGLDSGTLDPRCWSNATWQHFTDQFSLADGGLIEEIVIYACVPPPFPMPEPSSNEAPSADAGADQTLEATGPVTDATLDGSASSDPDGDALTYAWSNGATTATTQASLGLGAHTFTLTVDDGNGGSDSDDVTVTIEDNTGPTLDFTMGVTEIWPPNKKMVTVASGIFAADLVDGAVAVSVTVSSNEAITADDWAVVANSDGTYDVQVRADRDGGGTGRTYVIAATATDASGNTTEGTGTVLVPHDQGKRR